MTHRKKYYNFDLVTKTRRKIPNVRLYTHNLRVPSNSFNQFVIVQTNIYILARYACRSLHDFSRKQEPTRRCLRQLGTKTWHFVPQKCERVKKFHNEAYLSKVHVEHTRHKMASTSIYIYFNRA